MAIDYDEFEVMQEVTMDQPSSFYGRHNDARVIMEPEVNISYPINTLFGSHLELGKLSHENDV